jgi:cytidylate kinase
MVIIIEGMDNTGKTTLATKLADDLKMVWVNNRHKPKSYEDMADWTYSMAELARRNNVLFDRWCAISEPVYGPICRNINIATEADLTGLYMYLQRMVPKHLVIWCKPPREVVISSIDTRDQMEGVVANTHKLLDEYDERMKKVKLHLNVVEWDYTKDDYSKLRQVITGIWHGMVQ